MKANHNGSATANSKIGAVSNGSKILKWKQITTVNADSTWDTELFPMVQRY